ncbi:MAG TPA: CHAT domain-containing tetratricopeptide repeat protein [Ohtaekwangia sp.]|uniref:CHAT domain-containing tetratricopeptide repeat protein n=1 Tax=Ohtaekwangia sp. TaxID=2066019 RepID=UPI002F94D787
MRTLLSLIYLPLFCFVMLTEAIAQQTADIDQYILNADYGKALAQIDQQLSTTTHAQTSVLLLNKKAEVLIHQGHFDDAEKLLSTIAAKTEDAAFLKAVTQSHYGLLYLNQGRNDLAEDALKKSLQLFEDAGKSETLEAAQALAYLGNLYSATGKYAQAEEQLNMALTLRQKQLKENHELIAASYNDLGLVFTATDPDKALEFYEKALAIYQNIHGKEHPKIAIANTNIGFVYRKLELYGDAVNNFESALKIWEKVYTGPHPSKAFVLFNLGETYMKIGDQKASAAFYERALLMYQQSYGRKHPEIARVLNAIASIDIASSQYSKGLSHYQEALQANVSDFDNSDIRTTPRLHNFYDGNVLLYSLLGKAQALESQYYGKTLKLQNLTDALQTLQVCDTLIDKLRQQITNENDKILLGTIANEVYADGVRIAHETGAVAFVKKPYFEMAFYFAEKSKSAVLLEAISDANAKSFAGIPTELLEEEKSLKTAIALCSQKLAQKPSADEEKYLRETSFSLNRSYEAFIRRLEQQFPEYFNLKFNASSPSIQQLQTRLNKTTALLSYFIDDKNNHLYIFEITKRKYSIHDHALPKDFNRYITGMRNGIFFNEMKAYVTASQQLSALLLPAHIPSSVNDLLILPTGRLSIIPFEALFTREPLPVDTYKTLPYLVGRYNIHYEFSARLILQKNNVSLSATPSILLCAPVTFPEEDGLNELPGTESEVTAIAQLFSAKNFNSGLFIKQTADEKLIKSDKIKNYKYVHLATHGVVDESNPALSRIFLQSDVGSEDGNLFAGEIYNLNLNADLVTLSACQTGLGKISKGEGVVGLSRALVYAGARNIIVSFWSVADESTSELMKNFYRKMLDEPSVNFSGSLRKAKLDLIAQEQYAAPYYWAPFILIGF